MSHERDLMINGFTVLPSVVPQDLLERLRDDFAKALQICARAQLDADLEDMSGTAHHLPIFGGAFLEFLEANPAAEVIAKFFGHRPYVLNSMGGQLNDGMNYAGRIHRDIRSWWTDRLMLNTIVCLDEYSTENGATWLMRGGHYFQVQPTEGEFNARAIQMEAPAGSIILFDSRVFHRAGENRSGKPRRILTPIFATPHYKPEFDLCRAIGYEKVAAMSERLKQVLGYFARTPSTLEEFYASPEKRFYWRTQG